MVIGHQPGIPHGTDDVIDDASVGFPSRTIPSQRCTTGATSAPQLTIQDWVLTTGIKGTLFTVQKALALMNDGGSIVLNGSVESVKGTPAFGVYGATKAALRSFSEPGRRISRIATFAQTLSGRAPPIADRGWPT
jgi:hypothetical protein